MENLFPNKPLGPVNPFQALEPKAGEAADEIAALLEEGGAGGEQTAILLLMYYELASMLGIESTPRAVLDVARRGPPEARRWGLAVAGAIADPPAIACLAAVLEERDARGAMGSHFADAVEAAGSTRSPHLARLLERHLASRDPSTRSHVESIVASLGAIGDSGSREALLSVMEGPFSAAERAEARSSLGRLEILHAPDRDLRLLSFVEHLWVSGADFRSDSWALGWMVDHRLTHLAGPVRGIYEGRKHRLSASGAWSEKAMLLDAIRRLGGAITEEEVAYLEKAGRLRSSRPRGRNPR